MVISYSVSNQTKLQQHDASNFNSSLNNRQKIDPNIKIKASINIKDSRMNFNFWQRVLVLGFFIMCLMTILCKTLYDSTQENAYQNHIKIYNIGGFMRTLTYIGKTGIKFQIGRIIPDLNLTNYYKGTFFDSVVMEDFDKRLMINLLTITDFLADQKLSLTLDQLGNAFSNRQECERKSLQRLLPDCFRFCSAR